MGAISNSLVEQIYDKPKTMQSTKTRTKRCKMLIFLFLNFLTPEGVRAPTVVSLFLFCLILQPKKLARGQQKKLALAERHIFLSPYQQYTQKKRGRGNQRGEWSDYFFFSLLFRRTLVLCILDHFCVLRPQTRFFFLRTLGVDAGGLGCRGCDDHRLHEGCAHSGDGSFR